MTDNTVWGEDHPTASDRRERALSQRLVLANRLFETFLDWRHKIILRFSVAIGALIVGIGWLLDRGHPLWLAGVACIAISVTAVVCHRLDIVNQDMMDYAYRVGAHAERNIGVEVENGLFVQLEERSGSREGDGSAHSRRRYRTILRWVYLGIAVVSAFIGIVLMGAAAAGVGWLVGDRDPGSLEVADPPAQAADWGAPRELAADDEAVWIAFGAPAADGQPPQGVGGIVRLDVDGGQFDVVAEIAELSSVAVADHPEGTSLWAARWPGELVRLEAATGEVQARIDLPAPSGFADIDGAFLPNGVIATSQAVWVTTARGVVALVAPARNTVDDVVELVPDYPRGGAARGPVAWISQGNRGVARVDALASHPVQTFQPQLDGDHLTVADFAMAEDRLWVAGRVGAGQLRDHDRGAIVALDPDTGEVLAQADTPEPVGEIAVAADRVWATAGGPHSALWHAPTGLDGRQAARRARELRPSTGALHTAHDALWALDRDTPALLRLHAETGDPLDTIALPTAADEPS